MKRVLFMLLVTVSLIACDEGGEDAPPKSITTPNQQQLTQTVYADDNAGKTDVTFATTGAWTSEIKESATTKSTRAAADWISISPSSGDKAGDYTISISLQTNFTGEKRSATISLKCSGEMIHIAITQEAVTAAGDKPEPDPEPSGEGMLKNETTGESVKLIGVTHEISNFDRVRITFVGEGEKGHEYMADFHNPLQDGKLKSGVYTVRAINVYPYPEMKNGDCGWWKSTLAGYGETGTIKVELNAGVYTFTFDIRTEEGDKTHKLTGSFTGVPKYLNKEVKVTSITLNETSKTLEMGENVSLTATILPENATDKRYTWSSSNPAVATVSEEGLVKSVAAGTTTITATSTEGAKTATCAVTVKAAVTVTGITVDPTEVTLLEGEYLDFYMEDKVTVLPKNATNKNFTFKSSDENVATYTGKAIEAKTAGVAAITFTTEDGAKTATLKVTVNKRPTSGSGTITRVDPYGKYDDLIHTIIRVDHTILSKNSVELSFVNTQGSVVGKFKFYNPLANGHLSAGTYRCAYPDNGTNGTFSNINSGEWGNSREGSITVGVSGDTYTIALNVTETGGGFTFSGNYSGSLTYTNEYADVSSVTLNKTTLSLTIGGGAQLEAAVNPNNAFNKNVTWSTSNSSVASVSNDGYVYTNGVGSATITVTTEDGAKTATCQVTVNALPTTGSGTFSNNQSQSLPIDRAEQWVNEKEPKEIDIRFVKPNSAYGNLSFTLVRAASDTGALKAGSYTSVINLMCDELGVKHSYENTGSVVVSLSGENYTVTLDVTSSDDIKITGIYTGKIPKV